MRLKLKYLLPLTQIVVAIFLLHQYQRWMILTRHDDMPGPGPAANLLGLINLPVALLRGVSFRSFDLDWPDWIFVVVLAILWYWLGREIESRLDRRRQATIGRQLVRIATDVLLTVCSAGLVFWGHYELLSLPWSYFAPSVVFLLFWVFVPPLLLGYDLYSVARRTWMISHA
jgi:hypothetical protein